MRRADFSMSDCKSAVRAAVQRESAPEKHRVLPRDGQEFLGRNRMSAWRIIAFLLLGAALGIAGCGSKASSSVALTISPTTASVITNRTQQFSGLVTGSSNTAITWSLACQTGVAANACGSIDAAGLYTAPPTIPTVPSTTSGAAPSPA